MYVFAGICMWCAIFMILFIPETKGKSHEQIMKSLKSNTHYCFWALDGRILFLFFFNWIFVLNIYWGILCEIITKIDLILITNWFNNWQEPKMSKSI